MQKTPKLGLNKPELNEYVNIADLNENMDVLDNAVGELQEGTTVIPELETNDKTLSGAINEVKKDLETHETTSMQQITDVKSDTTAIKNDTTAIKSDTTKLLNQVNAGVGKVMRTQTFRTPGTFTWTRPAGVTRVLITASGAGGGGSVIQAGVYNGNAGGVTSFGTMLSLSGGAGASISGGSGAGAGGSGYPGNASDSSSGAGGSGYGHGSARNDSNLNGYKGGVGAGGAGANAGNYGGGGGAGDYVIDYEVTVSSNVSVVVGKGGAGANFIGSDRTIKAGDGGDGILIVKWFE